MSKAFKTTDVDIIYVPTGEVMQTIDMLNDCVERFIEVRVNEIVKEIIDERMEKEMQHFDNYIKSNYVNRADIVQGNEDITKNAHAGRKKGSYKLDNAKIRDIYFDYKFKDLSCNKLAKLYGVSDKTINKYIQLYESNNHEILENIPADNIDGLGYKIFVAQAETPPDNDTH